MEMIRTKKKDNNESDRHDRKKERVSLLENFSNPRSKSTDSTGQLKNRERRRTKAKAHPSPSGKDEEVVSLLGDGGKDNSRSKHAFSSSDNASRNSKYNKNKSNLPPWTLSRLMKYFAILLGSAMVSFLLLRKQSKVLHWDEYHNILEPSESKAEPRCFVSRTPTYFTSLHGCIIAHRFKLVIRRGLFEKNRNQVLISLFLWSKCNHSSFFTTYNIYLYRFFLMRIN